MTDFETISSLLSYNPTTGIIQWRVDRRPNIKVGDIAGTVSSIGYIYICVNLKRMLAHRIAWLLFYGEWPSRELDHIDGNRSHNSIHNLRMAHRWQNCGNHRTHKHNISGLKGVRKQGKRYIARIVRDGVKYHLGTFDTPEEAHAAYYNAAKLYFGEFARAA